jgi:acyl carrier protein
MGSAVPNVRSAEEIQNWIVERLVTDLGIDRSEVDGSQPLVALGVDSMQVVVMIGELEEWLGIKFLDNPLIDYPTIAALSAYLADQVAQGHTEVDPGRVDSTNER